MLQCPEPPHRLTRKSRYLPIQRSRANPPPFKLLPTPATYINSSNNTSIRYAPTTSHHTPLLPPPRRSRPRSHRHRQPWPCVVVRCSSVSYELQISAGGGGGLADCLCLCVCGYLPLGGTAIANPLSLSPIPSLPSSRKRHPRVPWGGGVGVDLVIHPLPWVCRACKAGKVR